MLLPYDSATDLLEASAGRIDYPTPFCRAGPFPLYEDPETSLCFEPPPPAVPAT
jgi:hypothetical protein